VANTSEHVEHAFDGENLLMLNQKVGQLDSFDRPARRASGLTVVRVRRVELLDHVESTLVNSD
jgi:hypothetical protein